MYPIFSCRCESVGRRLQLVAMPNVSGHTLLYIGDDVRFGGNVTISSGRFWDRPTLRIGNRAFIGHNVIITCNRQVVIEDDVLIAGNCKISDYDGHPTLMEKRVAGCAPDLEDMQPVRICRGSLDRIRRVDFEGSYDWRRWYCWGQQCGDSRCSPTLRRCRVSSQGGQANRGARLDRRNENYFRRVRVRQSCKTLRRHTRS